jgi:hypothetical protein
MHYLPNHYAEFPVQVYAKSVLYKNLDEVLIKDILQKSIKSVEVRFLGSEDQKEKTYWFERSMLFYLDNKQKNDETVNLLNQEFIRLGLLEYINTT